MGEKHAGLAHLLEKGPENHHNGTIYNTPIICTFFKTKMYFSDLGKRLKFSEPWPPGKVELTTGYVYHWYINTLDFTRASHNALPRILHLIVNSMAQVPKMGNFWCFWTMLNQLYCLKLHRHVIFAVILLCCSNVVQVPLSLNPFQFQLNLEFGTTHQVALCVVHPRYTKSNQIYNKSQN